MLRAAFACHIGPKPSCGRLLPISRHRGSDLRGCSHIRWITPDYGLQGSNLVERLFALRAELCCGNIATTDQRFSKSTGSRTSVTRKYFANAG